MAGRLPSSLSYSGADPQLLQKVLDNLISNALYYSPGKNTIRTRLFLESGRVCFSVENTGSHIPNESLPKLFDAFYRVEQSRNRRSGGSGLGLAIVKTILKLHQARYEISNTEEGVQFQIWF